MVTPLAGIGLGLQTAAGVGSFVSGVVGSRRRRRRLARIAAGDDPVVQALRGSAASQAIRTGFATAAASGANPAQGLREGLGTVLQLGQSAEDRIAPIQAQRQEDAQVQLEDRRQQRLQQGLSGASLLLNTVGTGLGIRDALNAQQGTQKPVDKNADIAAFQAQQAGQATPQAQTAAPTSGVNPETATPFANFDGFEQAPEPQAVIADSLNSFGLDEQQQAAFMEMMDPESLADYFNTILAGDTQRAQEIIDNFLMFYEPGAELAQLQQQANLMPGGELVNAVVGNQSVFDGLMQGSAEGLARVRSAVR